MKKFVLCSSSLPTPCSDALVSLGFEPIHMPEYFRLQKPVASHPDMLLHIIGDKYVTTSEYYVIASEVFEKINSAGLSPVLTDEIPSPDYPNDVLFNALKLGGYLIGLEGAMSSKLKECAKSDSLSILNVKQGYSKCSVCKVSDNAIITSDSSIANAIRKKDIDVLEIRSGWVEIDGYDHGFIGGASGAFENKIFFCGNVLRHPDGERIYDFCKKHHKECICLSNDTLFDVGTLFFL